ncbi:MAG: hypothetical protein PVG81_14265 [Desulfobacterales bacterium]
MDGFWLRALPQEKLWHRIADRRLYVPLKFQDQKDDKTCEEDLIMRIILKEVVSPKRDPQDTAPLPVAGKRGPIRNRRKNKVDRRSSVRDGVFVTLSTRKDRRSGKDRRRRPS